MHSTITPRRSEHTRRERSAATAAGFAQLRATRLAKLEKKDEIAGATAQQQQKQSEINVENNNDSAGVKAQQQKQQPPKSDSTQRKFLVEVHRGAGRLTLTVKGVKRDPGAPAASPSGHSEKTDKGPAATTDKGRDAAVTNNKKRASGEDELPPLPREVARCSAKGAAVKRKHVATASDDTHKKWAAAAK